MGASEYDHKPGGSLKFKGTDGKKRKSKKGSSSTLTKQRDTASTQDRSFERDGSEEAPLQPLDGSASPKEGGVIHTDGIKMDKDADIVSPKSSLTESERRYEEVRRRRLADKVRKEAKKSHKERVQEFNEKLEGMSEHYDLPRIGPG
ncbi:MAG: hypothetical protein CYPHOPRED_004597 [Cyphobasidiales sp. Tagirdzhanova-0007]|nr:MAG: hypothetical protein CYPHOPRED_004597 [Cyphobasidiales sp. Tagirdzhanova-0007]